RELPPGRGLAARIASRGRPPGAAVPAPVVTRIVARRRRAARRPGALRHLLPGDARVRGPRRNLPARRRTALRLRRVAHLRALRLHGTRRGRRAGLARRPTDATGVGASPRPGGRGSPGARPRRASVHARPARVARRARSRRDGTGARRPAALEPHIEDRSGPDAWRGARRLPVAVGGW